MTDSIEDRVARLEKSFGMPVKIDPSAPDDKITIEVQKELTFSPGEVNQMAREMKDLHARLEKSQAETLAARAYIQHVEAEVRKAIGIWGNGPSDIPVAKMVQSAFDAVSAFRSQAVNEVAELVEYVVNTCHEYGADKDEDEPTGALSSMFHHWQGAWVDERNRVLALEKELEETTRLAKWASKTVDLTYLAMGPDRSRSKDDLPQSARILRDRIYEQEATINRVRQLLQWFATRQEADSYGAHTVADLIQEALDNDPNRERA